MKKRVFLAIVAGMLLMGGCVPVISTGTSPSVAVAQPSPTPSPIVQNPAPTFTPQQPTPEPKPTIVQKPVPIPADKTACEKRIIQVYQKVSPAVVNITTKILTEDFFWGIVPEEGAGSGFLWDRDGHIVTNYHVVEGAQSIQVSFGDQVSEPAKIVGVDPLNDLAVIQVDRVPAAVEPVRPGDMSSVMVGETAIAIGNPFGQFGRTLTAGVVSALDRTIKTEQGVLRHAIQTDAAINHGNSGGPLLDSSGRLIGVNSAIYSPSGTSAGVGFAIPVSTVLRVVPVLIKNGRYPHPWLGAIGYDITPSLAEALQLPVDHGLLVARLYEGSPAAKAGIRGARRIVVVGNRRFLIGGDILLKVDDHRLTTWEDLDDYLETNTRVGQTVKFTLIRGGKKIMVPVTLEERPEGL
jgi:S1-C subfamily serine protease